MATESTDRADAAARAYAVARAQGLVYDESFFMAGWSAAERRERERMAGLLAAVERFRDSPHVLELRPEGEGWGLQHPPQCRPMLTHCDVHNAALDMEKPPRPPGRYVVEATEHAGLLVFLGEWEGGDAAADVLAALAALAEGEE